MRERESEAAPVRASGLRLTVDGATELAGTGVTATSMHPGWVDTAGVQDALPTFRKITGPFLRNEAEGADTIVWLVASDEAASAAGGFTTIAGLGRHTA